MDAFRETHELMDSLISSYQAGCKEDTDAVKEVQRLVADTLASAADREQHVAHIIKGAGQQHPGGACVQGHPDALLQRARAAPHAPLTPRLARAAPVANPC